MADNPNAMYQISNMLELENGNTLSRLTIESRRENEIMRRLSEKATSDAASVKILTVTTLVYLPATAVLVSVLALLL